MATTFLGIDELLNCKARACAIVPNILSIFNKSICFAMCLIIILVSKRLRFACFTSPRQELFKIYFVVVF